MVPMLSVIIEKGLSRNSKRKMNFSVVMLDRPGSPMKFTKIVTALGQILFRLGMIEPQ